MNEIKEQEKKVKFLKELLKEAEDNSFCLKAEEEIDNNRKNIIDYFSI